MAKFNVHVYTIVRVKLEGIEASSPKEAAEIASKENFYDRFIGENQEWAEQHESYFVDTLDENSEVDYDLSESFLDSFQVADMQHCLELGIELITI